MARERTVIVDIKVCQDDYLAWYQGAINTVYTRCLDGRSVSFPAAILRPFVTHNGIEGRFQIIFSAENKFKSIHRVM